MTGISRMLMTDTEKTREEKVFGQDVSREEPEHVAGGDNCGRNAYRNGKCPNGGVYIQRCSMNSNQPEEDPSIPETPNQGMPGPEIPYLVEKPDQSKE